MPGKKNRFIKKQPHRTKDVSLVKERKFNLPVWISIFSLLTAIIGISLTYWFNYNNYKKQYAEDLRISVMRRFDDYSTRIYEGIGKNYIEIQFHCKIINNSEKPVILERFESVSSDGLMKCWALYYGIGKLEAVSLPITIESKSTEEFVIKQSMRMDSSAFSWLKESLPSLSDISIHDVNLIVARKETDIFGCKAFVKIWNDREVLAYAHPGELYEKQSFTGTFETTNEKFEIKYSYYFDHDVEW